MTDAERREAAAEWIRSRPAAIHPLMIMFPPACEVRATKPYAHPPPGRTGLVASYLEGGTVTVESPDALGVTVGRGECDPEALEVVAYAEWTPDDVADALGYGSAARALSFYSTPKATYLAFLRRSLPRGPENAP